jgi:hypothetical protein
MRKPRNTQYRLKAYYIENGIEKLFWCKENKIRNITNEMGASLPMANGERMLETDTNIEFKINQNVRIGNETLLVQSSNGNIDLDDLNSMRNKPDYIQFVLVK